MEGRGATGEGAMSAPADDGDDWPHDDAAMSGEADNGDDWPRDDAAMSSEADDDDDDRLSDDAAIQGNDWQAGNCTTWAERHKNPDCNT